MFETRRYKSTLGSAAGILELIYFSTVRQVRQNHGHAVIGLLLNIFQSLLFVVAFFLIFMLIRFRPAGIHGDFLLFLMSGVFPFMVHVKALGAVVMADGPTSEMMKHGPMNTVISITSSALASLYLQILSILVILFFYNAFVVRITINDPIGALAMILMAWISGVGIGMVLLAARPWNPSLVGIISTIIMRVNMVASGKMIVANTAGNWGLMVFGWNPLYHVIDHTRGYVFANYSPRFTSLHYPIYFTLALIMIGLMAEFFTRRHASSSWDAKR
jgi:ABC-type polysaccharide/polyol phosphate export permease